MRIPEIRRYAIQPFKIAATEMFLAIPFFNKYVCLSTFPIPCEQQFLSLSVGRLGSSRGLGMLFGYCQGQPKSPKEASMKKFVVVAVLLLVVAALPAMAQKDTIRIGINAEMTGDIPKVGRGHQVRGPDVARGRHEGGRARGRGQEVQGRARDRGQRGQGGVRRQGGHQADHGRRGDRHRRPAGLQAGRARGRGLQQLQDPHDHGLVHQPQHHQGPALRLPRLLPGRLPGAGAVDLRLGRVQVQKGGRALRRRQRLPQGPGRVLQEGLGEEERPRLRRGL